jgi:3-dehydroquinate dehydratase-1
LVVGTIHSPGALKCALKLKPGQVDILELRVDAFEREPRVLLDAVPKLGFPLLLTVRHSAEGGVARYTVHRRRELIGQFLPHVQWVDFEVRSLVLLKEEIALSKEMGVKVVVSDHHFRGTPSLAVLEDRCARARVCSPDVVKVAATVRGPSELERLFGFFNRVNARYPGCNSVMGMGPFGQVSRLLFGRCGSVLNYGYLDQAQVPGQWPAELLKRRLAELEAGQ